MQSVGCNPIFGPEEIDREIFFGVNAEMFIDRAAQLELAAAITARDGANAHRLAEALLSQLVVPLQAGT